MKAGFMKRRIRKCSFLDASEDKDCGNDFFFFLLIELLGSFFYFTSHLSITLFNQISFSFLSMNFLSLYFFSFFNHMCRLFFPSRLLTKIFVYFFVHDFFHSNIVDFKRCFILPPAVYFNVKLRLQKQMLSSLWKQHVTSGVQLR